MPLANQLVNWVISLYWSISCRYEASEGAETLRELGGGGPGGELGTCVCLEAVSPGREGCGLGRERARELHSMVSNPAGPSERQTWQAGPWSKI